MCAFWFICNVFFFVCFSRGSDALDHVAIASVVIEASSNKAKKRVARSLAKMKQLAMMAAKSGAAQTDVSAAFSDEISANASRVMVKVQTVVAETRRTAVKMVRMATPLVDHGTAASGHAIDQTKIVAANKYVIQMLTTDKKK